MAKDDIRAKTNFNLSPIYSLHESSTRESASTARGMIERGDLFIPRAHTGTYANRA